MVYKIKPTSLGILNSNGSSELYKKNLSRIGEGVYDYDRKYKQTNRDYYFIEDAVCYNLVYSLYVCLTVCMYVVKLCNYILYIFILYYLFCMSGVYVYLYYIVYT